MSQPRVTVDEIIERRRQKVRKPDQQQEIPSDGEEMEEFQHLDATLTKDESVESPLELAGSEQDDSDPGIEEEDEEVEQEQEDAEVSSTPALTDGEEDGADSVAGSFIFPFAQLANASASHPDIDDDHDDEVMNSISAVEAEDPRSSYFSKAHPFNGPLVSSNEAFSSSSALPSFSALPGASLSRPILLGLASLKLVTPTPVQAQTIPVALLGKDIVGSSITGSGKTVAFWVGVLERLLYRDKKVASTRVVVICPTRELAVQVHNVGMTLARYTDIRFCLCVGGLSLKAQEADLRARPDILVCTPGRLIDHVRNTASFTLESLEILIIDEADRILEEGFRDELSEIISSCPHDRQTMLFSATVTEDINTLARLSLQKPVRIQIDAQHSTSRNLVQEFIKVRHVTHRAAILVKLCRERFNEKCIIFFNSKLGAHRMKIIFGLLGLKAEELHGDLTQEVRLNALKRFRDGQVGFLLATDLASVSIPTSD